MHAIFKGETLPSDEKEPSLLDEQVECLPPPGDDLPYGENPVGTVLEQPESIQISDNDAYSQFVFETKIVGVHPRKRSPSQTNGKDFMAVVCLDDDCNLNNPICKRQGSKKV